MLELKGIFAGYGKREVLRGTTLSLQRGELLCLIGPNGCGKSTLIKTVPRILTPTDGEISADGENISVLGRRGWAKRIAYLPQGMDAPDMRVGQTVLHGRFPHVGGIGRYGERDREIAAAAMARVGIAELASEPVASLSGGMRQSVYIAMALAQQADYLLLDEPTTYLDPAHQHSVMCLLRELAAEGRGILAVMHDLPLAFEFSDRIAVMKDGMIVTVGTPARLCGCEEIKDVFGVSVLPTEDGGYYCKHL